MRATRATTATTERGFVYRKPQNPVTPNPSDVKKYFYKQYRQKLNDCIKKVFGKDAKKVAEQTLNNAPTLNASLTGTQVGAISGIPSAIGNSKPLQGRSSAYSWRGIRR